MVWHDPKYRYRAWLPPDKIEVAAREQLDNLAQVPGLHQWIAVMPDVHPGFGMPIGAVAALDGYIIPNAVGVDIGCGVVAVATGLEAQRVRPRMHHLLTDLLGHIPLGFRKHPQPQASALWQSAPPEAIVQRELGNARHQLGSLGGGNHFIEFQQDPEGNLWLMLHSGSRNLGKQVADHYNKEAQRLLRARGEVHPPGLAWLELDSPQGRDYFAAMNFALDFAAANRRRMADICLEQLYKLFSGTPGNWLETIHNYAAREIHFDKDVVVHRKGAVLARERVVIPGSMGTASYIGQGLAHPDSFCSCAHGAGRVLGRKQARQTLNRQQVLDQLQRQNIQFISPDKGALLEEASAAYKDIDAVMTYQQELVQSLVRLEPLGVLKG